MTQEMVTALIVALIITGLFYGAQRYLLERFFMMFLDICGEKGSPPPERKRFFSVSGFSNDTKSQLLKIDSSLAKRCISFRKYLFFIWLWCIAVFALIFIAVKMNAV